MFNLFKCQPVFVCDLEDLRLMTSAATRCACWSVFLGGFRWEDGLRLKVFLGFQPLEAKKFVSTEYMLGAIEDNMNYYTIWHMIWYWSMFLILFLLGYLSRSSSVILAESPTKKADGRWLIDSLMGQAIHPHLLPYPSSLFVPIDIWLVDSWYSCWWFRNPAPIERWFTPFFTRFYTSQVVSWISSINSLSRI